MSTDNHHADDFDTQLAARFEREHRHVPDEPFVANAIRAVRRQRRWQARLRAALQIAGLATLVIASPWLIAGAAKLNGVLESSLSWMNGSFNWVPALLAAGTVIAMRVRKR